MEAASQERGKVSLGADGTGCRLRRDDFRWAEDMVYVAGSSNVVYGINAANGSVVWSRIFESRLAATGGPYQGSFLCPNGITATPAIDRGADTMFVIADRTKNTSAAVLYALDAKSGQQLWSIGNAINTWVHFSGLAIADGRVYAVDHDSWLYSFGLKQP